MSDPASPYDLDLQIYPRDSDLKHWEWVIWDNEKIVDSGEVKGSERSARQEGEAARQRIIDRRRRRSST